MTTQKIEHILTMGDVIKENQLQQAAEEKAIELYSLRRNYRIERERKILAENPHIGVLNGGAYEWDKFYSYETGQYVESYNIADLI